MKTKTKGTKLHTLIHDMPIEEYHGTTGTYSSSQFKDLLDDPDVFIKKYIEKTIQREEIAAFDIGTYFHTGVLEPHKLKSDCVVYPGKVRRGKDWEAFKARHKGKTIVTDLQKNQAEGLVRAVKDSPVAQEYLNGTPEVSLFVEIVIHEDKIYAPHFGKMLTSDGWVTGAPKNTKGAFTFVVKVRADDHGGTYISDLKSTTGNAKSERSMREKISHYQYDLSAALYLDIFGLKHPELLEPCMIDGVKCANFVWIFASKDLYNSKSYHASWENYLVGRSKYMRAMKRMADCALAKWQSVDSIGVLAPLPYELEWLKERDIDLL
jgi:hypothetical protein